MPSYGFANYKMRELGLFLYYLLLLPLKLMLT
jgi:hypothetical protein